MSQEDIICAVATSVGQGAISIVRLSGEGSHRVLLSMFNKNIDNIQSHTLHFGKIVSSDTVIDEVLVSFFHRQRSYSGQEMVEIGCHASPYIVGKIMELLIDKGCRIAQPGEFSQRAFLNGKIDLLQAESIPELIASETEIEHKFAMYQMRGGFSKDLQDIRQQLIDFKALLELELDFSEEDLEFVNRDHLLEIVNVAMKQIQDLQLSFQNGNVLKKGIPIVIAGKPNVGKSTLMNTLLNEEKALVTNIPGTTRDSIEDVFQINGIKFRLIDTAGLRKTQNPIESMGIERAVKMIDQAELVLYLFDIGNTTPQQLEEEILKLPPNKKIILVGNKADRYHNNTFETQTETIAISAKKQIGIEELKKKIETASHATKIKESGFILTNARHYHCLKKACQALEIVRTGIKENRPQELLAIDLQDALLNIGEITGQITNDDVLGSVFSRFCVGK